MQPMRPYVIKRTLKLLCVLLASVCLCAGLSAQTGDVSIRGQVTDQSGATVSGVAVKVVSAGGEVHEVQTDPSDGRYAVRNLPPGKYSIRISVPGFAEFEKTGVVIARGLPQTVDARLTVMMEHQQVSVNGDEVAADVSVNSTSAASALVLHGDDLQALSDDPTDFEADLQSLAGPSAGPSGGSFFVNGFSGGGLPAKESIREIRINQNPFSPEYDKLGYGRVEIFTKPGTERYHGTIDYNFGSDFWNSRNPYSTQKAPFLINEFEGNFGGPIKKRASFTVEYQRNLVDNGSITNAVTLDPSTLVAQPFNQILKTPQRYTRINPRVDYQLNNVNTFMVSYEMARSDIRDDGIGAFDLISRGYHLHYLDQTVQLTETAVMGTTINETRFQFYRSASQMIANNSGPEIHVLGSFNSGGSQYGQSFDTQNNFELQNYTSMLRSAHTWRFGIRLRGTIDDNVATQNFNGTFTFAGGIAPSLDANNQAILDPSAHPVLTQIKSIERYRRTLLFQQLGYSPAQIQALGGGATQFTIDTGIPQLSAHQVDVGVFAGDEWKVRSNLTVNLGLRYEAQSNIHDWHDFAPRIAIAWSPESDAKHPSKTVLRGGVGIFYDRFTLGSTEAAQRFNGIVQHQYVVTNPAFFPNIPSNFQATDTVQQVSPVLRAPYVIQSSASLERQLPANIAIAITYTNTHGMHLFRSEDVNAPLPGTYDPNVQGSGTFPLGRPGPVFLMESSGVYNQNQLVANLTAKPKAGFSLFAFYVLNHAMSNTDGIATVPGNPYNFSGEYGPASTDVRHRATVGGSLNTKWNVRISPFVTVQSGAPFDVTAGSDLYGTTLFNGRPGIATDLSRPGLIQTQYGLLDPSPSPGEQILQRNYGRGPGQIRMNLRISKAVGFGPKIGGAGGEKRQGPASANVGPVAGRGIGSLIGMPKTARRYNLIFSMSAQNVLNHTNPGPIIGDITSPLFGFANQTAGGPNGEGLLETANNRRVEMQIRLSF